MHHVCMFSFGEMSWVAAKRTVARHGAADVTLLFADTKYEDEDTYRWGRAAAKDVGATLVEIADGRDIWQVFRDERLIGNSAKDPCSKILKRQLCRRWMADHYPDPASAAVVVGIHRDENHRLPGITRAWSPYTVEAPLCDPPVISPMDVRKMLSDAGLWRQRLYEEGFLHANCGGRCVKAGHAQWRLLLLRRRESFLEEERKEEEMRQFLGKDVAILRDRSGGTSRPLTLRAFRERVEAGGQCDLYDFGGCDCFTAPEENENAKEDQP